MIKIKNLTKEIVDKLLFEDIGFTLNRGDKVALLGPNGCGKSTLFNIILGEVDADSGQVVIQDERIGHLPQEFSFPSNQTVEEFLQQAVGSIDQTWRVEKTLSLLGMNDIPLQTKTDNLSEGQKIKVYLASLMVEEPTFLLIDEPTNHLDIDGILWFESFIENYPGGILMISHDRMFIDNTVSQIFEFDEHKLHIFEGNYTDYKEQKEGWFVRREQLFKAQEKKRKQIETLIENARKIKDGKKRGKAIRAAKKRMDREILQNEMGQYQAYNMEGITLQGGIHKRKLMLSARGVAKRFGKNQILTDVNFELRGQQRAWLFGHNGAGKTTLLNIITRNLSADSGEVSFGSNIRWGYFKQNQEHLDKKKRVGEFLEETAGLLPHQAYSFLQQFKFDKDYIDRRIGQLSPGERARLSFDIFTQEEYELLILDEPTNHLDIWTKEAIEEALSTFKGSLLLVSHDRYFVDNVGVEVIWHLDNGVVTPVSSMDKLGIM